MTASPSSVPQQKYARSSSEQNSIRIQLACVYDYIIFASYGFIVPCISIYYILYPLLTLFTRVYIPAPTLGIYYVKAFRTRTASTRSSCRAIRKSRITISFSTCSTFIFEGACIKFHVFVLSLIISKRYSVWTASSWHYFFITGLTLVEEEIYSHVRSTSFD